MAKTKVRYCNSCNTYTEQTYKGKPDKSADDKEFCVFASVMTMGAYVLVDKVLDDRPKFWKCSRCGNISKSHK